MNQKIDLYDGLGIVAMIATPLAAAIIFGWNLYSYLVSAMVPMALAILGAAAGAVAMESVGIYAGHVAIDYTRRRDWRALVAFAALVFYIGFGWSKVPTYGAVFILAGFMYALVALRHEAVVVDEETAVTEKEDRNWEKRLQMEKLRMAHDEKLARIAATPTRKDSGKIAVQARQDSGMLPEDWRQVTTAQRHELAHMTREQRVKNMPELSERALRDWHVRLDKIAAQNGSYMEAK